MFVRTLTSGIGFLLLLTTTACKTTDDNSGLQDCNPDGTCPAGEVCRQSDNKCVPGSGGTPDAHATTIDVRPPDAMVIPPPPDANPMVPDTTITSQPPALGNDATVMFTFTSTITPATFACSMDGAAFAACTTPYSATVADGAHTFAVRATSGGETDATPATAMFTTDTTPPVTTITAESFQQIENSPNATITFTANEPATFQCKLDTAAYAPCTSPAMYTNIMSGQHVFTVQATDLAGNVEVTPPTFDWTVDLSLPDTMLTHAPDPDSASPIADFSFVSVPPGATFQCRLDSIVETDYKVCVSPLEYTGLADGQHVFDVRAVNANGTDPTPAHFVWLIDTTGPRAEISGGPADPNNACPVVNFTYTTQPQEGDASFICALVAGAGPAGTADYAPCSINGENYSGLQDGQYTFSVIAVDPLGNKGAADSETFTVDGKGPTIAISSPTGGDTGTSIIVSFSSSGSANDTFKCTVSGGASTEVINNCMSGQMITGLSAGPNTVTVTGTDQCGNIGTASTNIDVVVPTVVTVESPSTGANVCTVGTILYATAMAKSVTCTLDGSPVTCDLSGVYTYSGLTGGSHTFTVTGLDANMQVVGMSSTTFTVDTVGPALAINTPVSHPATGEPGRTCPMGQITFGCDPSADAVDCPPSSAQCSLDHADFKDCSSLVFNYSDLMNGTHTLTVHGGDSCGNIGPDVTTSWIVEGAAVPVFTTPPAIAEYHAEQAGPNIECEGTLSAAYVFTTTDPDPKTKCLVDGVDVTTDQGVVCTRTTFSDPTDLADGSHTLEIQASDACGEVTSSGVQTFTVKTAAPVIDPTSLLPANGSVLCMNSAQLSFSTNPTEPASTTYSCTVTTGGAAQTPGPCMTGNTLTNLSQGPNSVSVTATDACSQSSTPVSTAFSVVTTAPTFTTSPTISQFHAEDPTNGSPNIVCTGSLSATYAILTADPTATVTCTLDGTVVTNGVAGITCGSTGFSDSNTLPDGSHTLEIQVSDSCGGSLDSGIISFNIKTAKPAVAVTTPLDGSALCGSNSTDFDFGTTPSEPPSTTYVCTLSQNGATVSSGTCSSGQAYSSLVEGPSSLSVTATDVCGNTGTATASFGVDSNKPVFSAGPSITGLHVEGSSTDNPDILCTGTLGATYTFTSGGISNVTCLVDGVDVSSTSTCNKTTFAYSGTLTDGAHTVEIEGTDACGQVGDSGPLAFTVKTANPVLVASSLNPGSCTTVCSDDPKFFFGTGDANDPAEPPSTTYSCTVTNNTTQHTGTAFPCSSGDAIETPNGDVSITVVATDVCKNSSDPASTRFTTDNSADCGIPPPGSCMPSSSLSVLIEQDNVIAFIPQGSWDSGTESPGGVEVLNIEGTAATLHTIQTPFSVNACATNFTTEQTVCTANNTDVYVIDSPSSNEVDAIYSSGASGTISFSGGECVDCGVTMDAIHNQAVIEVGVSNGVGGFEFLDLGPPSTPGPSGFMEDPFASQSPGQQISENILIDGFRNLILSASERNSYELVKVRPLPDPAYCPQTNEFFENPNIGSFGTIGSAGEDCSTGILLAPYEFSNPSVVYIADVTQGTFTAGAPGTWSAPSQNQSLSESFLAAGASGIAVAQGTHIGIVAGEFPNQGSNITAIKLPTVSGSGTPTISDWVTCSIPDFIPGLDPHTVTAYQSPSTGHAMAVVADEGEFVTDSASGTEEVVIGVAVIDLTLLLDTTATPRTTGSGLGHACATVNMFSNVLRFASVATCASDADCPTSVNSFFGEGNPATEYCDLTSGQCQPSRASGDSCTTPDQCASQECVGNGTCGCSQDSECASGDYCDVGSSNRVLPHRGARRPGEETTGTFECLPQAAIGGSCTAPDQCLSGSCIGDVCTCNSDSQCPSQNFCNTDTGACQAELGNTMACTAADQCLSGFCDTANTGECQPCATDIDCGGGEYCNQANQTCQTQGNQGAACTVNDACLSGYCDTANTQECQYCFADSECSAGSYCADYDYCVPLIVDGAYCGNNPDITDNYDSSCVSDCCCSQTFDCGEDVPGSCDCYDGGGAKTVHPPSPHVPHAPVSDKK